MNTGSCRRQIMRGGLAVMLAALILLTSIFALVVPASASVESLGNVINATVSGSTVTLTIDNGSEPSDDILEIQVCESDILKVNYRPDGVASSASTPIIDPELSWQTVSAQIDVSGDPITISTGDMQKLEPDEIVTEVSIPAQEGAVTHYDKFRLRDSVDFAMVSLASSYKLEGGKIASASLVLGGVAPVPLRREAAEAYLAGREPNEETAKAAAELALEGALPFEKNQYKVQVARTLIERSVLRLR